MKSPILLSMIALSILCPTVARAVTISDIPNQCVLENSGPRTLEFTVKDAGPFGFGLIAFSDNSSLIPPTSLSSSTTDGSATITFAIAANLTGEARLEIKFLTGIGVIAKDITVKVVPTPGLQCPSAISIDADAGSCGAVVTYPTPVVTDSCPDITAVQTAGLPSGAMFPIGTTLNTFEVADGSGNKVPCSFTVTVNGTELPKITCPAAITQPNDPGLCGAVVTYSPPASTDNCPGVTIVQTAGLPSGAMFPIGTTVNSFEVTDAGGNKSSCSFSVTVKDTELPKIICPVAITQPNDPGLCGAVVTYSSPASTDNCPGVTIVQTAGLPSGVMFPIGTTVNSFEVTDAGGNKNSCSFSVTVKDTEAPKITCPVAITQPNDPGLCGAVVTYSPPASTDNCPGVTIVQTVGLPSGAMFPIGTTINSFEVTDASGNKSSCSFSITVKDTEPPRITCPADKLVNTDPLSCTAIVRDIGPLSAEDNCPNMRITYELTGATTSSGFDDASGSAFNPGLTTVTYTITDAAGLTTSCSLTVTVAKANPIVTLTGPASGSLYTVNTPVNFTATFTGGSGTHTGAWMFDSISQPATIVEPSIGSPGLASATYTFTAAGVYRVKLSITDSCGGSSPANPIGGMDQLVVVYDPSAGFVTGGGWITSPAGAFAADPTLTGKANFGFVSKFQKGATAPAGNTDFQFRAGSFHFQTTAYQWLVVSGTKAQFKGTGKVNGSGSYDFLLTATDGEVSGGGVDRFRIKITDGNGFVVYDNDRAGSDAIDEANARALGGGSIIIHN